MNHSTATVVFATTAAFAAGLVASSLATNYVSNAYAQSTPLAPAMVDLAAMKHADMPTTPQSRNEHADARHDR